MRQKNKSSNLNRMRTFSAVKGAYKNSSDTAEIIALKMKRARERDGAPDRDPGSVPASRPPRAQKIRRSKSDFGYRHRAHHLGCPRRFFQVYILKRHEASVGRHCSEASRPDQRYRDAAMKERPPDVPLPRAAVFYRSLSEIPPGTRHPRGCVHSVRWIPEAEYGSSCLY